MVGLLLLALGALTLLMGLVGHFSRHPDELARPWQLLGRADALPVVLSHLSAHPTTALGIVAALFFSVGVILIAVCHQRQRTSRHG